MTPGPRMAMPARSTTPPSRPMSTPARSGVPAVEPGFPASGPVVALEMVVALTPPGSAPGREPPVPGVQRFREGGAQASSVASIPSISVSM